MFFTPSEQGEISVTYDKLCDPNNVTISGGGIRKQRVPLENVPGRTTRSFVFVGPGEANNVGYLRNNREMDIKLGSETIPMEVYVSGICTSRESS